MVTGDASPPFDHGWYRTENRLVKIQRQELHSPAFCGWAAGGARRVSLAALFGCRRGTVSFAGKHQAARRLRGHRVSDGKTPQE